MDRRRFLQLSAAGAGAALALPLLRGRTASAAPFGEFPDAYQSKLLPPERRAKRVLEVFLYGGLSPWESIYFVEEYGTPTDPMHPNTQFYTFGSTGSASPQGAMQRCGVTPAPLGEDFATDANGAMVKLGPFCDVLRQRTDITGRMRIHVNHHELEPHEAAIPLALTGKPVGSTTLAGLGTHIQRYYVDRPDPTRKSPYSYVFSTGGLPGDNVQAAFATGMHPGTARPLRIKIDNTERFSELLARGVVGPDAQTRGKYDALVAAYATQYQKRLVWPGRPDPVRSSRFADLQAARQSVANADALAAVFDPSFFNPVQSTVCTDTAENVMQMSFKLAAHLLTHPDQPARYACVVDTGLIEASGGGGYDTHTDNSQDQARNLRNLWQQLTSIINAPGENDPTKISLDDTLVILNTEFGRTPTAQGDRFGNAGSGRNHHPYGYATAMFGGPITTAEKGVVGAIGPDGIASSYVLPSETRMAALLAMGIWPFAPEAFGVSDVNGGVDEPGSVEMVTQKLLGITL
jgi:hypothetical protein